MQAERIRLEKQQEQERKRAEQLARIEWKRPRDDLLCDDLQVASQECYLSFLIPSKNV